MGSWVRVRTQLYKGDLAKVMNIDLTRGQAEVRLVPRLDYAAMAKARAEAGGPGGNRFGRQAPGALRPAAKCAAPFVMHAVCMHRDLADKVVIYRMRGQ